MTPELISACMLLWDMGYDTRDMARLSGKPEYTCARALRIGREDRLHSRNSGESSPPRETDGVLAESAVSRPNQSWERALV